MRFSFVFFEIMQTLMCFNNKLSQIVYNFRMKVKMKLLADKNAKD